MRRILIQIVLIIFLESAMISSAYCVPVPQVDTAKPIINKTETEQVLNAKSHNKESKEPAKKENLSTNKKIDNQKETTVQKSENKKITQDKLDSYQEIRDQAKLLYNVNKSDEAVKLYNSIPDSEKISDDWLILANISQDKNKEVDAVFYLKKAIQADEKNYKAHYNLGNMYYYDNKYNMALNEYRKVLRIKKDFAYAYYNKGCCYLKKKSWFNAKYEFGLAIKSNPEEPSFYYNLAYTYKMMKKDKKAQEALDIYNKLMTEQ